MGVAGEIGEHRPGPGEGRLGVDKPVLPLERREVSGEGGPIAQAIQFTEERQTDRPVIQLIGNLRVRKSI